MMQFAPLKRIRFICQLAVASFLLFSQSVLAGNGVLSVEVIDAKTNRAVVSAQLTLSARDGNQRRGESGANGRIVFRDLSPGLYNLQITRRGYRPAKLPSVRVVDDKLTPLKVELSLARAAIEEVVVVGEKIAEGAAVGAGFLDREALRSGAGSGGDVLRALDGLPGLFSSGEFSSFTVRGRGPRDNLILVDGVPFANVVHFESEFGAQEEDEEGGGRYSIFAPNLIAAAEFEPGGWSAAYAGRSGGLLNLNVAEGNPETSSYTLRFDIAGPEFGYDGPSYIFDNTSLLFSARRLDFGRFFESIGIEDIGSPRLTDVIFKTRTQINNNNAINFLLIHAPEDFIRDIDNVLASDEDDPGNYEDVLLATADSNNQLMSVSWTALLGDNAEWINRWYFRGFDQNTTTGEAFPDLVPAGSAAEDIPRRESIVRSRREEKEFGWRSDFSIDNAFGRMSTGFRISRTSLDFQLSLDDDWIRYIYETDDFRPDPNQRFIVFTPDTFNNQFEEESDSFAAFVDQNFEIGSSDFRLGLRFDRDSLAEEDLVSPRLSWVLPASEQLTLSATGGIYYQSPRVSDRASDSQNTGLQNEKIVQSSVGAKFGINEQWALFFETYYQDLSRLVVEGDSVNQFFSNLGEGESYGFDTGLTRNFSDGWSAYANYSYNHTRVKDSPNSVEYDADFSRPHAVNIGGVWEINARWKLSARWKWASGATRDEFVVYDNVLGDGEPLRFSKEITAKNADRFQSFHSLNFRADYRRSFGRTNIIAFVDVINLYGAANPSSSEFNERSGEDVVEDGEAFPLLGFRLEW